MQWFTRLWNIKVILFISTLISILVSFGLFVYLDSYEYVHSDGIGYYSYLPAITIDHDTSFNTRVDLYAEKFNETPPELGECEVGNLLCDEYIGLKPQSNGTWLNKYPVGVAILLAPLFFVADVFVQISGGTRDGISEPYQISVALTGIIWFQFAIYYTYKVLRNRFNKDNSLLMLFFLLGGTNIIHYAIYLPSMSHIYSYTLITVCVYLLDKYHSKPTNKNIFLIGVCLAVITLIRNVNILFSLVPLISILSNTIRKDRFDVLKRIALMWSITLLLVLTPQITYWKIATGNFLIYGYPNESFNLLKPQLINMMFYFKSNGLFFWHPLLLLVFPGILTWLKSNDKIKHASILFLVSMTYILSCWWAYWFGYSFGHRAFTDFYILFLIPITNLLSKLIKTKYRLIIIVVICFFLYLNLVQLNLYWRGIVSSHNNTWDNYIENFANPRKDISL